MRQDRYINPYTDFGFKRLFGTVLNKELLISFLNALLDEDIDDIQYSNNEHLNDFTDSRRAIFDVYCTNTRGEAFIVEMQNVYQQFYKDRSIYYSTFPIREQALSGTWNYEFKSVYTVGILNFVFQDKSYAADDYKHVVKLMDVVTKEVFYDKLTYVYLEMPKFTKGEYELVTMLDKWLFVLHNLSRLFERPAALQERVFKRLFEQAEIANYTPVERHAYESSMKAYRDLDNAIDTAEQAKAREIALNLKLSGVDVNLIAQATGLTVEQINELH